MVGIFTANYPSVLSAEGDLIIRISGLNAAPAGGVLSYLHSGGAPKTLSGTRDPAAPSDVTWMVKNLTPTQLDLVTPGGTVAVAPSIASPPEFAFSLAAHAINPASGRAETVRVSVTQGGIIVPAHWYDRFGVLQTAAAVNMGGSTFTLYLGA